MILCDWCGQPKECLQKEIDGREFDICADCWNPIEEKLKGKGLPKRKREMVFLPHTPERESDEPKRPPGPPKIFGRLNYSPLGVASHAVLPTSSAVPRSVAC
jgi:hypothetical protein